MLKYVLASILFVAPFTVASTPIADAGLFANRPVRSFFQNRKPVRRVVRAAVRFTVAPIKFVATRQPIRKTVKRATFAPSISGRSGGCVNCGTEG